MMHSLDQKKKKTHTTQFKTHWRFLLTDWDALSILARSCSSSCLICYRSALLFLLKEREEGLAWVCDMSRGPVRCVWMFFVWGACVCASSVYRAHLFGGRTQSGKVCAGEEFTHSTKVQLWAPTWRRKRGEEGEEESWTRGGVIEVCPSLEGVWWFPCLSPRPPLLHHKQICVNTNRAGKEIPGEENKTTLSAIRTATRKPLARLRVSLKTAAVRKNAERKCVKWS